MGQIRNTSAGLALLMLAVAGCASQSAVQGYVLNLVPVEMNLFEQRVQMTVRLQNLTDTPMELRGMRMLLDVNGAHLAEGVSNDPVLLPALGEAKASVVLSLSTVDIIRQFLAIEQRTSFDYVLTGTLYPDAGWRNLRFRRSGELSREQLSGLVR